MRKHGNVKVSHVLGLNLEHLANRSTMPCNWSGSIFWVLFSSTQCGKNSCWSLVTFLVRSVTFPTEIMVFPDVIDIFGFFQIMAAMSSESSTTTNYTVPARNWASAVIWCDGDLVDYAVSRANPGKRMMSLVVYDFRGLALGLYWAYPNIKSRNVERYNQPIHRV